LFPESATWFLSELQPSKNNQWFSEFLLSCSDMFARQAFVAMTFSAVSALVAAEPNNEVSVQAFVQHVINGIRTTYGHWRTCDEYFGLIRELASIPSVCAFMISKHVLPLLSFYSIQAESPAQIKSFMASGSTAKVAPKNFIILPVDLIPVYPSIFEAIAAVLNVPQRQKVNLSKDSIVSYWDSELNQLAKDAFTAMFAESCTIAGVLSTPDIIAYMQKTQNVTFTAQQVRLWVDKFEPLGNDGKLSLQGFLKFYAEEYYMYPKQVWKHLHAFNFKNDLSRSLQPVEEGIDFSGLPSLSLFTTFDWQCFQHFKFFETALEYCDTAAMAIVQRVCRANPSLILDLIKTGCARIFALSQDYYHTALVEKIAGLMKVLLLLPGNPDARIEAMLSGDSGLLTAIVNEHTAVQQNRRSTGMAIEFKFIDIMKELYKVESCKQFILARAGVREFKWLLEKLNPPVMKPLTANSVVNVIGAGFTACNGPYTFSHRANEWDFFTKAAFFQNKQVEFSLYRTKMKEGGYRWYISHLFNRDNIGNRDIDFYYADAVIRELGFADPSKARWLSGGQNYVYPPTMTVSEVPSPPQAANVVQTVFQNNNLMRNDSDDDDDDNEDSTSQNAVNDDEEYDRYT